MSMSILPAFILTALGLAGQPDADDAGPYAGRRRVVRHAVPAGVHGQYPGHAAGAGRHSPWPASGGVSTRRRGKRSLSLLTFPLFMLTYLPISLAALFMKVEWKPIHHSVNLTSLPSPAVKN